MAKSLGKLRQQTIKLKELEAPSDATKATKTFVKKHVYVVHPDANENGDDVFRATNIKRSKRFPEHGYEPGMDKDVYEDFDRENYHKSEADKHSRYADAIEKKDPGKAVAYRILAKKHLRQAAKHASSHDAVAEGYDDVDTDRKEARRLFAKAANKRRLAPSARDDHRLSRRMWADNLEDEADNHESDAKKMLIRAKKKTGIKNEETDIEEVMIPAMPAIYSALSRSSRTAYNPSSKRPAPKDKEAYWKGTLDLTPDMQDPAQKAQMAKFNDKIGRLADMRKSKPVRTESYEEKEDRNNEHHYLNTLIADHIDELHKTIASHVNLMDKMNDKRHDTSFNSLMGVHDHLEKLVDRVKGIHDSARRQMGMHTDDPGKVHYAPHVPVQDTGGNQLSGGSAVGKYSEGFEHIEDLSESDQALLVDTYNSLTEENQDRFLEIAETQEGVDHLLDFAITNRGAA